MISRASRAASLALLGLWIAAGAACEGTIIDGGNGSVAPATSQSVPPPVDVRKSFFGRLTLRALTRSASPEGTEVSPESVGITLELGLAEDGTYALDDGKACIRGRYTFQSGVAGRGAFSFEPLIGRAGTHDFEFRDQNVAVADVVAGYPWARLAPTGQSNRCDAR